MEAWFERVEVFSTMLNERFLSLEASSAIAKEWFWGAKASFGE
jgi:hypothetical protein